ncbi:MAG: hypothetical protein AB8G18_12840 [Gammaproteobacteria bacterium]
MNKIKMTAAVAAATLICSGAFAGDDQGGGINVPTSVEITQEAGNVSLLDKLVDFLLATDRGG